MGNKDWPGNNTVIFKNMNANAADKRWKYIPYDLDYSYGLNNGILSVSANEDSFGYLMRNIPLVNWTLNDEPSTLLFRKLIQNSQFKEELIDRYVYHLNTTFNKQRLNTVLDKFYNEVNEYKNMQFNRWSLPLTWGGTISDMRRFINNREAGIISSISRNLGTDGETKGSFANTAQGKLQIQIGDKSINIDKSLSGSFIKNRPIKLAAPQGDTFRGFQIVDGANSYIVNESNYEFVPTADNFSVEVLTDGGEIENYNALAAGDGHIVKIVNGAVKTWGKNAKGQIAQWNTNNMSTEVELKYQNTIGHQQTRFSFTNAKSVFAANEQSFVLTEDGKLYSSGDDSYYQINNGGSTPGARDYMAQIYRQSNRTVNNEIGNIKEVAAGQKHTLFIDENNMLYSCGSNDYDQLGNGSMASSGTHLIKVSETLLFKSVAAGEKHSLAVTTDGNLYAFGDNSLGQFGDGTVISSNVPKFIMNNVDKVFTKYNSTFILKADGTVYACGDNTFGQLGTGNTDNALTPVHVMDNCAYISTSKTNTVFITSDNYLWTVGSNAYGQLLSGTSLMNTTPAKVRGNCASAVAGNGFVAYENSAGQLFIKGNNAYGQLCSGSISENDTDAFILNSIGVSCNANIENEIIPKDIEISGYAVNGSVTSGAKDITVYFAVYSKSGKLVDLISDKVTVNALLKSEFSLKKILNNSYSTDNYFCRLMCWDSSAMIPVNKVSVEKNP